MTFLVDFNLDGYALLFLGILTKIGWLELVSIRFVTFREARLLMDASDRLVWCYAQENQMMILTANRNMKGEDSLKQVMLHRKIQQIRFLYWQLQISIALTNLTTESDVLSILLRLF
ncbi:hypothetical protein [Microcoleus vaginatus]|uniref:hypothetical protein n=1 Tax=Microcoleus vaginatus TaxID=119532 RepID=UPI004040994B